MVDVVSPFPHKKQNSKASIMDMSRKHHLVVILELLPPWGCQHCPLVSVRRHCGGAGLMVSWAPLEWTGLFRVTVQLGFTKRRPSLSSKSWEVLFNPITLLPLTPSAPPLFFLTPSCSLSVLYVLRSSRDLSSLHCRSCNFTYCFIGRPV